MKIINYLWSTCFLLGVLPCLSASPSFPAWWTTRGILDPTIVPNDYAPANVGQAKWFAKNAIDELNQKLPGGAGFSLSDLIDTEADANDFAPLNVGQLKYIAYRFYDRLADINYTLTPVNLSHPQGYPWSLTNDDDYDFQPVNVGQLKYVFSFDFQGNGYVFHSSEIQVDSDFGGLGDGIGDDWELAFFGSLSTVNGNSSQGTLTDLDGDGQSDYHEFWGLTDPTSRDHPDVNLLIFNL